MSDSIIKILYMVSCIFFIRGIKLLGKTDTARKGLGHLVVFVTWFGPCGAEDGDAWADFGHFLHAIHKLGHDLED